MTRIGTDWKALAALALGLAIVAAVGIAGYRTLAQLAGGADEARPDMSLGIERAIADLRRAEAAHLRHESVGAPDEYAAASAAARKALDALETSVDDPLTRAAGRRFEAIARERLDDMDASAARIAPSRVAATRADAAASRAAAELNAAIASLRRSQRLALRKVALEEREQARMARYLALSGTVLSICLMAWGMCLLRRNAGERDRALVLLRESEARIRAILQEMAEAVITTEVDGTIVGCNSAAQELFGYSALELRARNVTDLVPPRHRAFLRATLDEIVSNPQAVRERGREVSALRKDGTKLCLHASFSESAGADGRRLLTGLLTDVTETRRVSDALKASEKQLREIIDALPALVAYVDRDSRFVFHNKAYEDFFALAPGQIDGHPMLEVLGPEVWKILEDHVATVLGGAPVRYQRRQALRSGETRDLDVHFFPNQAADGTVVGFYSLATDITDMKRVDRMKSEFISTVSHELRTPLTSIRGSLGLLSGGISGRLPAQGQQLVDIAKNNCERLIRLINNILDIEKIESGKIRFELREHRIEGLVGQAVAALEGFAGELSVRLRLEAQDDAVVRVDGDRLVQVVTNLVSNAVRFSPVEGVVDVRIRVTGSSARVEVQDRGPGIPQEFRARIFEKFSQADASDSRLKGGTGLGLNISRAIVEQLGGRIGFDSSVGDGSTFFFELPCEPVAAPHVPAPGEGPRVLVCEDAPDIARLLTLMLQQAGFDACPAKDAAEARARLAGGRFAAMTLDLDLPGEDGASLLRSLRAQRSTRDLPVVVVSAAVEDGGVRLGSEDLSVSEWLGKPIDENRLIAAVRGAVAGWPGGSPRILHVEDDPDVRHIAAAIAPEYATMEFCDTVAGARERLATRTFDLVIVDMDLPDGSGEELARTLKALRPRTASLVFTSREISDSVRAGFDAALVKSKTTNRKLGSEIRRLLGLNRTEVHV